MNVAELGVIAAMGTSVVAAAISLGRWRHERREADRLAREQNIRAPAERDQIFIKGAESAVTVLERALALAQAERERKDFEVERLRGRVVELEEQVRERDRKLDQLERRLGALERTAGEREDRLDAVEQRQSDLDDRAR